MIKYSYRKALITEIDCVMEIIEDARALLKEEGNGQWQFGYPTREDLLNDINNNQLYCVIYENKIVSICALTYYEESYMHLYEGAWKSDYNYIVMHRVAVKKEYRNMGFGKALFEVFIDVAKKENIHSLRIDTHENNTLLRHLFDLYGFEYCGKAILPPNKDRVMYEKII